ncbi:MAG: hypothetical protein K6B74_00830 [Ruminococcus sp.]|nr:hypothetical protein [Ruminococcus sp.]
MKHTIVKRTLAGLLALTLVGGALPSVEIGNVKLLDTAVTAKADYALEGNGTEAGQVAGGWEFTQGGVAPSNNEAAVAALEKATLDIDGIAYTPVAVLGTQAVAGTNYAILCKVKAVAPEAKAQYQIIYVYEDLEGTAKIIGRKHIIGGETAPGSFEANDGDFLYNENENKAIFEAFDSAYEGLAGVDNRAYAYLGRQVVAGTNYLFLASATPVVPNPKSTYNFTTIYVDTDGKAQVNGHAKIELGEMDEELFDPTDVIYYAAAEPTCTMPGIVDYWYDSKNNKLYLDEALTQEFTDWNDVVIPPLGHDLDEPEWTWGEDNKTAHVTVTCKRCKEKVVDADAKVTVKRVEPTVEKAGSVTYTAAVMVGGEYYVDTKVEVLDKLSASNMPLITFERGDFRVKLNWTASEGATRYAVCGYVNKTWKILAQGNDTSYVLTKLTPGVNYKVAVIPMIDGAWKMDFSNAVTVTPKALKVPKLTVEQGENDIKLDWIEVEGAEKYGICGVVSGKWTLLDEGFNTSYILKNLKPGTKYTVAVIAKINGKWVKDYSNQVEVTTKTPVMPTVSYEKGKNAVKLTWTEYEGAEKYAVCGYSSGKWTKLAEGTGTSYIMNNLKTGSTYKVAVTVKVNGRWKVDYSNAIEVAPLDQRVLEYPEVKSQAYKDKFILKWSAVKNAEGYALAVKQSGKWTIKKQFDANTTTFTSPSMSKGDYRMVIIAKVDGKWQTNDADNRAITVSIF